VGVVSIADPVADPRWDAFVESHERAGTYHLAAWASILAKAYGFSPRYLALERDGRIDGVLPAVASFGVVHRRRLRSLPIVGSANPLANDEEGLRMLLEAGCRMREEIGARVWSLRSREPGYEQLVPDVRLRNSFQTIVAPLPDDADELRRSWKKTSNNLWRNLKKSESNVTARETTSDRDLRAFYAIYCATMRRHRSLPRSLRLFRLMRDRMSEKGVYKLVVAEHKGEVVAGGVFNTFNRNVDLVYNASSEAHLDLRPNHAVYWYAIRWGIENGYRSYNMGQAPEGGSLERFKRQWGGEFADRYDYEAGGKPAAPAAAVRDVMTELDVGERQESLLARAWDRTPLPLTRAAAELAYRFI
jgi:lipid II:glycine glycyltransferase (peptidoglycan interpeptide bridge formation enzyme)